MEDFFSNFVAFSEYPNFNRYKPSFRYQGSVPQEIFCRLPEAAAIFGNTTEIEVTTRCPNPGCFTYDFDYEQDVMNQLIAMTKQSLQCTQTLEFSCFSAPIRDLVGK